jgi:histidinol dehydrogenase
MLKIYSSSELTPGLRKRLLQRSSAEDREALSIAQSILDEIASDGLAALQRISERLDGVVPDPFLVTPEEFEEAEKALPPEVKQAFEAAFQNIKSFHVFQRKMLEDQKTTVCSSTLGYIYRPVERVAVYVPGGKAFYPSSVLMGVVPARIAGVSHITLLTPPGRDGKIHPAVLYCAKLAGVSDVLKAGGAHGVAAVYHGLLTPPVELIIGPGNRYVTAAKNLLAATGRVRIDQPAGPSEVIVIADQTARPAFVAADLLSQAEHGEDSPCILLTDSLVLAERISEEIVKGLEERPERRSMKEKSIREHSYAIVFQTIDEAIAFSNEYGPEHLEIATENPERHLEKITAAGSVFLGHYAPVALGDYFSGTNHILPTGGAARMFSGVGVDTFMKRITYQYPTRESLRKALEPIRIMSRVEGLHHEHGHSVEVRFEGEKEKSPLQD